MDQIENGSESSLEVTNTSSQNFVEAAAVSLENSELHTKEENPKLKPVKTTATMAPNNTKVEVVSQAAPTSEHGDNVNNYPNVEFVKRVYSLPVVNAAAQQLTSLYQSTKERSTLLNYTLNLTEGTVRTVANNTAVPLANRLNTPINMIDVFACGQLDRLEMMCPSVKKPVDELYDDTMKPTIDRLNSSMKATVETVNSAKDLGYQQVTRVRCMTESAVGGVYHAGERVVSVGDRILRPVVTPIGRVVRPVVAPLGRVVQGSVEYGLDRSDQILNYMVPQVEGDNEAENFQHGDLTRFHYVNRVDVMIARSRYRAYAKVKREAGELVKVLTGYLESTRHALKVAQEAKTNLQNKVVSTAGDVKARTIQVSERVRGLWSEISLSEEELERLQVEGEAENARALEARVVATLRHLVLTVRRQQRHLAVVVTPYIPATVSTQLSRALTATDDVYRHFTKVSSVRELPDVALSEARRAVSFLSETLTTANEYIQNAYHSQGILGLLTFWREAEQKLEEKDSELNGAPSGMVMKALPSALRIPAAQPSA